MRIPRYANLVALALLLGACSAGATELAATQRQGLATPSSLTTTPPTAPPAVEPAPAVPASAPAPEGVAPAPDGVGLALEAQDPVPTGVVRPRSAAPVQAAGRAGPRPTGHISIPSIGLAHDTYEGIDLATIDHGPSHWPGTAMPGQPGNTVFPGHRTTHSRPFWDIDRIRVGDQVVFTTPSGRFTYKATKTFVVDDEDVYIVDQTSDATFTIFACHPKGSAKQRYVVQGVLVASERAGAPAQPSGATTTTAPEERKGIAGLLGG